MELRGSTVKKDAGVAAGSREMVGRELRVLAVVVGSLRRGRWACLDAGYKGAEGCCGAAVA